MKKKENFVYIYIYFVMSICCHDRLVNMINNEETEHQSIKFYQINQVFKLRKSLLDSFKSEKINIWKKKKNLIIFIGILHIDY